MLLTASYFFYASWDWRFLFLILFSTILDYFCGLKIYAENQLSRKRLFLILSISGNLLILGFFKYFNFFTANFQFLLRHFGIEVDPIFLDIVLPVGISFYTFQTMSYTIDIYRNELSPTSHYIDFALFVAFFPQLVAGPIERAKNLLPQISRPRKVNLEKINEGIYLIVWGLFQKIFVADNLARIVDPVFLSSPPYIGVNVLIAIYAFAFQIYCDFAGYSNIARGISKCMGFEIMINFKLPYFSTNPQEFWRRWHISLSTWLRDYIYIPLGGSKFGILTAFKSLYITMLLGGLWHGASWVFIIWGGYHALLLSVHRFLLHLSRHVKFQLTVPSHTFWYIVKTVLFFHLACFGWLIFRSSSLSQTQEMFHALFFNFNIEDFSTIRSTIYQIAFFTLPLIVFEFIQFYRKNLLIIFEAPQFIKTAAYGAMVYFMLLYASPGYKFIYFQF
jgi:D-alanyl-lipoteichoic acid acyltransferase DltB (MBOAT superfamily)